ncbi:hypothetical protein CJJ23_00950 [Mycoplasmopsis agassizii]|uniref:Lipoprotein-associated type-17 domain-containing protein n=1 Tax=Mycoplasmopsis agassizii TaxID=33922 RepID=A0A269TL73_9BACT|nr:lipoprotein 17-related variable surface protein [Mycoplasmopsis agassizii]PAK21688.1 hypothetical protein CJJ23_00950 [Mycoplasmopsis agassizii]
MKKLNKKSFLFLGGIVATGVAATAIACSNGTGSEAEKTAMVAKVANQVRSLNLVASATYENLESLKTALENANDVEKISAVLNQTSATGFKKVFSDNSDVKLKSTNGVRIDLGKVIVSITLTFQDSNITVSSNVNIVINTEELEINIAKSKTWYAKLSKTNTAGDSFKNNLPSKTKTVDSFVFANALTSVPEGYDAHFVVVKDSANDTNGSLKVNVVLGKGLEYFNLDETVTRDLNTAKGVEVTISGFATSETFKEPTDKEIVTTWYQTVADTNTAGTNFKNHLPSSVGPLNASVFATALRVSPEGFSQNFVVVANSIDDKTGMLKVKVVLSKGAQFFNLDGTVTDSLEAATGKEVTVSGFEVNNPEIITNWYEKVSASSDVSDSFKTTLASKVLTVDSSVFKVPLTSGPENFSTHFVVVENSADDEKGTLKVKIVLAKATQFFNRDGSAVLAVSEADGTEVLLTGFAKKDESKTPEKPDFSAEIAKAKTWYSTINLTNKTGNNFKNTLPSKIDVVDGSVFEHALTNSPEGLTINYEVVKGSSNDNEGSLKVKVVLAKGTNFFNEDGSISTSLAQAVGKEITVLGFKKLSDEQPNQPVETVNQQVKKWFTFLSSTFIHLSERERVTWPSDITNEMLSAELAKWVKGPKDEFTNPEGTIPEIKLFPENTTDDSQGIVYINVSLKNSEGKYFNKDGVEQDEPYLQKARVQGLLSYQTFAQNLYDQIKDFKIENSTNNVSNSPESKNASLLEKHFEYLTLNKKYDFKILLENSPAKDAINDKEGTLKVRAYVTREGHYLGYFGTDVESKAKAHFIDITVSGFRIISDLENAVEKITNFKVKDNLAIADAKKIKALNNSDVNLEKLIETLNLGLVADKQLNFDTKNLELVSTKDLITLEFDDRSTAIAVKITLKDKTTQLSTTLQFKTDFNGFLPLFLTPEKRPTVDLNNKYAVIEFKEFKKTTSQTSQQRIKQFISAFVKANQNDSAKLNNFANSFSYAVSSRVSSGIDKLNLIIPYNVEEFKATNNPINWMVNAATGNIPESWIGASREFTVFGGLQNNTRNNEANGKPWNYNAADGTKKLTFATIDNKQYWITNKDSQFVGNSRSTIKTSATTSPFTDGLAVAVRLLMDTLK